MPLGCLPSGPPLHFTKKKSAGRRTHTTTTFEFLWTCALSQVFVLLPIDSASTCLRLWEKRASLNPALQIICFAPSAFGLSIPFPPWNFASLWGRREVLLTNQVETHAIWKLRSAAAMPQFVPVCMQWMYVQPGVNTQSRRYQGHLRGTRHPLPAHHCPELKLAPLLIPLNLLSHISINPFRLSSFVNARPPRPENSALFPLQALTPNRLPDVTGAQRLILLRESYTIWSL